MGQCPHRSSAAQPYALAALRYSFHDASARSRCRLWREQLSVGILRGRRGYRCRLRSGQSRSLSKRTPRTRARASWLVRLLRAA